MELLLLVVLQILILLSMGFAERLGAPWWYQCTGLICLVVIGNFIASMEPGQTG